MDLDQVSTDGEFVTYMRDLSQSAGAAYTGSLEEYLRSVLSVVTQHRNAPPSWRLLASVLTDAFATPPLPFDTTWLEFVHPPSVVRDPTSALADPFGALTHMLHYQIADLHRLREAGKLDDPFAYFGLTLPGGHTWYNFDPETFLKCASRGMNQDATGTDCSWIDLAIVLWLGQIYE